MEQKTEQKTQETIFQIASDVLGVPVSGDTTMENAAGWDSLKTLQIVMALDEAGLPIPLERIAEIRGASDLVRFAVTDHA